MSATAKRIVDEMLQFATDEDVLVNGYDERNRGRLEERVDGILAGDPAAKARDEAIAQIADLVLMQAAADDLTKAEAARVATQIYDTLAPETPTLDPEADQMAKAIRASYGLEDDVLVADNVTVKTAVLTGWTGEKGKIRVQMPAVMHEYGIGLEDDKPPVPVTKVCFITPSEQMRVYADLVYHGANTMADQADPLGGGLLG